jgi:hypothetical protein
VPSEEAQPEAERVITSRRRMRMAAGPLIRAGTPAACSPVNSDQRANCSVDQDDPVVKFGVHSRQQLAHAIALQTR